MTVVESNGDYNGEGLRVYMCVCVCVTYIHTYICIHYFWVFTDDFNLNQLAFNTVLVACIIYLFYYLCYRVFIVEDDSQYLQSKFPIINQQYVGCNSSFSDC